MEVVVRMEVVERGSRKEEWGVFVNVVHLLCF